MQKCVHGIKLQSANFSNSIIANLLGSIEGRRHNVSLMGESNLLQQPQQYWFVPDVLALPFW